MSENLELNLDAAWAWYDPATGILKHVTFIENQDPGNGTIQLSMDYTSAANIMTGASNLSHFKIVDKKGIPTIVYLAQSMASMINTFWALKECVPFDKKWKPGDDINSPIRMIRKKSGFSMYVVSYTENGKVYITLKDDPNWLVKTIDIGNAIAKHGLGPIPIKLDTDRNYSIYVRYDAA
jgi:hypothetical protein